jgi:hypothetical protein
MYRSYKLFLGKPRTFAPKTQRRFFNDAKQESTTATFNWFTSMAVLGGGFAAGYLITQMVNADDKKEQERLKSNAHNVDPYHDQKYPKFPEHVITFVIHHLIKLVRAS